MLTQINAEASSAVAQAIRSQEAEVAEVEEEAPPADVADDPNHGRGQTDTAALLRELSGLFQSGNEDSKPSNGGNGSGANGSGGSAPPSGQAAPARQAPGKDDGKKKKRGLFGR